MPELKHEKWLVRYIQAPGYQPQLMVLPWAETFAVQKVSGMMQWEVSAESPWQAVALAAAKAENERREKTAEPLWSIFLRQDGELAAHPYLAENQEGRERRCGNCAGEWHEYVRAPSPEQAASVARGHQIVAEYRQLQGQAALNRNSLNACSNEKRRGAGYSVPTPCQTEQLNSIPAHGVRAKITRSAEPFVQCFSTAGQKLAARLYRASLQRFFSGRAGKSDS